jgi:hypothetical protein
MLVLLGKPVIDLYFSFTSFAVFASFFFFCNFLIYICLARISGVDWF